MEDFDKLILSKKDDVKVLTNFQASIRKQWAKLLSEASRKKS